MDADGPGNASISLCRSHTINRCHNGSSLVCFGKTKGRYSMADDSFACHDPFDLSIHNEMGNCRDIDRCFGEHVSIHYWFLLQCDTNNKMFAQQFR